MDIRKPKPWRGWRELAKEIGTIVIGVLIALGAEQAVEALHWAHQIEAGEAALKTAYRREARNVAERGAQDACITERIAALSRIVAQASESGRLPAVGPLVHPPFTPWTIGAWNALVASQTVAHVPRERMMAYTQIAASTAYLSSLSDQEEAYWTILDSMTGPGRRLSDVEADKLRTTLAEAAGANRYMRSTTASLRQSLTASKLIDEAAFAEAVKATAARNAQACPPAPAPVHAPAT